MALARSDSRELIEMVTSWPPSEQRDGVLLELRQPYREIQMISLVQLALGYSKTQHAELGARISDAVEAVGMVAFERFAEAKVLTAVAWAATAAATSRATLGHVGQLLAGAEDALQWLAAHGNSERDCELHLWLAITHLARGALPDAERHLCEAESAPLAADAFGTRGRLRDVRDTYDRLAAQSATELAADPRTSAACARDSVADQLAAVAAHLASLPSASDEDARLASIVDGLHVGLDAYVADPLGPAGEALEQLADKYGAAERPSGRLGLQQRIREAGRMLVDPVRGKDPAVLQKWIVDLQQMAEAAAAQALGNDLMTIQWCLQLCHARRGEHDAAAAVLRALWESLEAMRATIADPVKRAGVLAEFPSLFSCMARSLFLADRPADLLEAIEGAKGRLLADVLDRNRADVTTVQREPVSLVALPAAVESAGVHYLTYLVADDDSIYAVLVARDRSLHSARIDLDRATLRAYGAWVDPSTWGKRIGGFQAPAVPSDLPDRLAPLVTWLEPLVATGVIRADDHMCYCPDDDLHLIPLHLLNLAGAPLVAHLSVSRVHSARSLLAILSAPPRRPNGGMVIEVPAAEDPKDMVAAFSTVGDHLLAELPGERLTGRHATVDRVLALELADRLVHFTTHGTFPSPRNLDVDPNPFRSSGMRLAANDALPSKLVVSSGTTEGVLSPERIGGIHLTGSHVTMMACSTGLSKEGTGGDALGLEWGFLFAGAASVLTAHWDVPLASSSELLLRFYDSWLVDRTTRAEAWRSAALGLLRDGASPMDWSGFSLAGDWR